jgi:DNA-directed RNA polymerase sigma subunit (sigma70/sigma32)
MKTTEKHSRRGALLSRADEAALAQRIERGDLNAKQTMIESNLGLVHAIADGKPIRIPPKASVHALLTAARVTASLDQPVGEDATPLSELIADPRAVDPLQSAIEHEQREEVSAMLELLPKRHREVLARRYGLDGHSVQSHEQISGRLEVGEERSRQIEHESLHRLRSIPTTLARAA